MLFPPAVGLHEEEMGSNQILNIEPNCLRIDALKAAHVSFSFTHNIE